MKRRADNNVCIIHFGFLFSMKQNWLSDLRRLIRVLNYRQATQKQSQDCEGYGKDERGGCQEGQEIVGCALCVIVDLDRS